LWASDWHQNSTLDGMSLLSLTSSVLSFLWMLYQFYAQIHSMNKE
jgi:hypothetical protein